MVEISNNQPQIQNMRFLRLLQFRYNLTWAHRRSSPSRCWMNISGICKEYQSTLLIEGQHLHSLPSKHEEYYTWHRRHHNKIGPVFKTPLQQRKSTESESPSETLQKSNMSSVLIPRDFHPNNQWCLVKHLCQGRTSQNNAKKENWIITCPEC